MSNQTSSKIKVLWDEILYRYASIHSSLLPPFQTNPEGEAASYFATQIHIYQTEW
jgi:hypothetical protein